MASLMPTGASVSIAPEGFKLHSSSDADADSAELENTTEVLLLCMMEFPKPIILRSNERCGSYSFVLPTFFKMRFTHQRIRDYLGLTQCQVLESHLSNYQYTTRTPMDNLPRAF